MYFPVHLDHPEEWEGAHYVWQPTLLQEEKPRFPLQWGSADEDRGTVGSRPTFGRVGWAARFIMQR